MKIKKDNKYLYISAGGNFYWMDDVCDATSFSKDEAKFHAKRYKAEIV